MRNKKIGTFLISAILISGCYHQYDNADYTAINITSSVKKEEPSFSGDFEVTTIPPNKLSINTSIPFCGDILATGLATRYRGDSLNQNYTISVSSGNGLRLMCNSCECMNDVILTVNIPVKITKGDHVYLFVNNESYGHQVLD